MANDWPRLVQACQRGIRYVNTNYVSKLAELVDQNLAAIEFTLQQFQEYETKYNENIDKMEVCVHDDASTDTIDEYKAQFEIISRNVTSALNVAIAEKTPIPERSMHTASDGGSEGTNRELRARVKMCTAQIATCNRNLAEIESFTTEYNPATPPTVSILKFHIYSITRIRAELNSSYATI